ncbi:MAG: hypothetical protein WDZ27_06740 [Waddliaceae bacterium]
MMLTLSAAFVVYKFVSKKFAKKAERLQNKPLSDEKLMPIARSAINCANMLDDNLAEEKVEPSLNPKGSKDIARNKPLSDERLKSIAQNALEYASMINKNLNLSSREVEQLFLNPKDSTGIAQRVYNTFTDCITISGYKDKSRIFTLSPWIDLFRNPKEFNICEFVLQKYLSGQFGTDQKINYYLRENDIKPFFMLSCYDPITREMRVYDGDISKEDKVLYEKEAAFLALCIQLYLVKHQKGPRPVNSGVVYRRVRIKDKEQAEIYKSIRHETTVQFLSTSRSNADRSFGNIQRKYELDEHELAGIKPPYQLITDHEEDEVLFPINAKLKILEVTED